MSHSGKHCRIRLTSEILFNNLSCKINDRNLINNLLYNCRIPSELLSVHFLSPEDHLSKTRLETPGIWWLDDCCPSKCALCPEVFGFLPSKVTLVPKMMQE